MPPSYARAAKVVKRAVLLDPGLAEREERFVRHRDPGGVAAVDRHARLADRDPQVRDAERVRGPAARQDVHEAGRPGLAPDELDHVSRRSAALAMLLERVASSRERGAADGRERSIEVGPVVAAENLPREVLVEPRVVVQRDTQRARESARPLVT